MVAVGEGAFAAFAEHVFFAQGMQIGLLLHLLLQRLPYRADDGRPVDKQQQLRFQPKHFLELLVQVGEGRFQLYLQLGEISADGSHVVRAWYKPYVTLIWLGAVVMAAAGVLSLTDRRLRVGLTARARKSVPEPAQ